MPQVGAFLATVSKIVTFGKVAGGTAALIIGATTIVGASFAASRLLRPKIDMDIGDGDGSRQRTVRSTIEPQKLVYGETMVSGPLTYAQVSGTNNKYLHQVIALAGHELTQIKEIHFDDKSIDITDSNIYSASNRSVISGFFGPKNDEGGNSETVVLIDTRLGTSSQTAYADLRSDSKTSQEYLATHRGDGIASLYTRWTLNEGSREVWDEVGSVQNIKAVVKGKKVYDPRLDVNAGNTAGTNPTNASYVVYSDNSLSTGSAVGNYDRSNQGQNPALILADYLMDSRFGLGVASSKIDWSSVVAAADHCDQLVPVPSSATQKRFFGSGVIFGGDKHRRSIEKILDAMNGSLVYTSGKYVIRAGVYFAVSETLTENDVIGPVQVRTSIPRSDRFNQVKGLFIDPNENYKMMEFGPVTTGANDFNSQPVGAIARDNGEVLTQEIRLPFTSNRYAAQRLALLQVAQSYHQTVITVPVNLKGMRIAIGDRVNLTIDALNEVDSGSWSPKIFKCIGWSFSESDQGGIDLTLIEDFSASYNNPQESDYSTITAEGVITTSLPDVPSPTNFTATAGINRVELDWTNPPNSGAWEQIWVYASASSTTPTDSSTPIAKFRGTSFTHMLDGGTNNYYWIQAVRYPNGTTPGSGQTNAAKSAFIPSSPTNVTANKITTAVIGDGQVDTTQIANDAIDSDKIDTIQSSNYSNSAGSEAGWKIDQDGSAEFNNVVVRGNVNATTGTIGGLTVGSDKIYVGTGTHNNSNTAFYVDDQGQFSLKDKLVWNGTALTIDGSGTFSGALSAATGSFTGTLSGGTISGGTISIGSNNDIFKADSNGIYLGNATFGSAPFRVTPAGALTATNATITGAVTATSGTFTGTVNASAGAFTGDVSTDSKFTAGSSNDVAIVDGGDALYRFYAGDASSENAAFRVDKDGHIDARDIKIYDEDGQVILDAEGFHGSGLGNISANSGIGVSEVAGKLDDNADEITFTTGTASEAYTFETKVQIDINQDAGSGESPTTSNLSFAGADQSAVTTIIGQVKLIVEYFVKTSGGSYSGTPDYTDEFTFVSGTSASSSQLGVNVFTLGSRGAGVVYANVGASEAIADPSISGARLFVKSTKDITFSTAATHNVKVNARIATTSGTTLTTSTTPALDASVTTGTGVILGSDETQSSLEDFRRLYTIKPASGNTKTIIASTTDDTFSSTGGSSLLTSGGTISGSLVVTQDLTVQGTTTTLDTTNTLIKDALIELNSGHTGANTNDTGLILERGSTGNNVFIGWDESSDRVTFATTTATGASTGNLSLTATDIQAAALRGSSVVTGGVTRLDNSGNLSSIGTISSGAISAGEQSVFTGNAISGTPNSNAQIVAADSGVAGIAIHADDGGQSYIWFGDTTDNAVGRIYYNHTLDKVFWRVGAANDVHTLDSSGNATFSGTLTGQKLVSTDGVLELDDNGTHNGIINVPASLRINIDSDNNNTGESFQVGSNVTNISGSNILFQVAESGNATVSGHLGVNTAASSSLVISAATSTANHLAAQFENSNTADSFGIVVKAGNDENDYAADFRKRDNTSILKLLGSGNATFSNTVTATALNLGDNSTNEIPIAFLSSSTDFALGANGNNFMLTQSTGDLDSNALLTISSTGNATFAGGITFSGDMFGTNSSSNLVIGNSASGNIYLGGGNSNTNNLYLQTGSSIALTLDVSNNATFAGSLTVNGSSKSSFYALQLARSSSGLTTPDIWGENSTLVLGTSSSDERLALSTSGATIYGAGTIKSDAGSGMAADIDFLSTNTSGFGSSYAIDSRIRSVTGGSSNAYHSQLEFPGNRQP